MAKKTSGPGEPAAFLTPGRLAAALGIRYVTALELCRDGAIKAVKEKSRWKIGRREFERVKNRNEKALGRLREEYTTLYRTGLGVRQLQNRVEDDFRRKGIIAEERGFAERTIYQAVMAEKEA